MNNTAEYLILTAIALLVGFYACAQLNYLLLDALHRVALMITGGF